MAWEKMKGLSGRREGGERETEAIKLGSLIGFLIFPFIGLLPLMYPNGPG